MMGKFWYVVVLISIAYVSWRAVAMYPPQVKEQREARYHYVRACMVCALLQLVFMFVLYSCKIGIGKMLPMACFATWTATIVLILFQHRVPKLVRQTAIVVIIGTPVILLLYPGSVPQFLEDADRFSSEIARRATATRTARTEPTNIVSKATETVKPDSRDSAHIESQSGGSENPTTISQVRISHLLRAVFFFINAFLVLHYFGTMWYFGYQERSRLALKAALEQDAADQIVLFLSIAFSLWLAVILLGFDTLSVSIFSGFVVVAVSFVLKDLLSNFISGALLLWLKSVRIGDVISINKSTVGRVVGVTMRYLIVEDRNDIEYLIPYSQLSSATIENWSKGKKQVRLKLDLSVAYGTPIEKVKDIVISVCFEVPRVLKSPLPVLQVIDMGESAIQFQLRFRIADPENGISNVKSELYERLLKRFEEAEIEIPYPQREIRIRPTSSGNPPSARMAA